MKTALLLLWKIVKVGLILLFLGLMLVGLWTGSAVVAMASAVLLAMTLASQL